jgi:RNA polymerase sigma-70 factor (ECF subfamily)
MFHMEGLQYQEIAARLGVPLGTVATWVMRARKSVAASVGVQEES